MYTYKDFPDCSPDERFDRGFDFVNDFTFDSTEIIVSQEWLCEVADDSAVADPSASSRLTGDFSIRVGPTSGRETIAAARLAGLVAGAKYRLTARVVTDRDQELELYAFQTCRPRD